MVNIFHGFRGKTEKVSRYMAIIGAISLVLIIVLITISTTKRYLTGKELFAVVNAGELLIVITTFFGLAWTQIKGLHVDCGVIFEHLSRKKQKIIQVFVFIPSLFFTFILFWTGMEVAIGSFKQRETAFVAGELVHVWPFKWFIPIGVIIYIAILLFQFKDSLINMQKEEER